MNANPGNIIATSALPIENTSAEASSNTEKTELRQQSRTEIPSFSAFCTLRFLFLFAGNRKCSTQNDGRAMQTFYMIFEYRVHGLEHVFFRNWLGLRLKYMNVREPRREKRIRWRRKRRRGGKPGTEWGQGIK